MAIKNLLNNKVSSVDKKQVSARLDTSLVNEFNELAGKLLKEKKISVSQTDVIEDAFKEFIKLATAELKKK